MTKISKQTKLEAILAYHAGFDSKAQVAKHYGIAQGLFSMLRAAYATYGPDVLLDPPEITGEFRITVASWAIRENRFIDGCCVQVWLRWHGTNY